MELMIKLLKVENEENALSCIKIMIDGIRNHKAGSILLETPADEDRSKPNRLSSLSSSL